MAPQRSTHRTHKPVAENVKFTGPTAPEADALTPGSAGGVAGAGCCCLRVSGFASSPMACSKIATRAAAAPARSSGDRKNKQRSRTIPNPASPSCHSSTPSSCWSRRPVRPRSRHVRTLRTHRYPAPTCPRSLHRCHHHGATPSTTTPTDAERPPQQLRPRVASPTTVSPGATMRNPQPLAHPSLRLLPTERSVPGVLDRRATASKLAAAFSPSMPPAPCLQPTASPSSTTRRGTTRERSPDAGASTPWYVTRCLRALRHQRAAFHQHLLRHHHRIVARIAGVNFATVVELPDPTNQVANAVQWRRYWPIVWG